MVEVLDNSEFRLKEYWDRRFAVEEEYDWLQSYDTYASLLKAKIEPRTQRILVLGCGNSTMSERMFHDGFHNIVNMDFSDVVIAKMREKYAHLKPMTWLTMDMRHLEFDDGSFDAVVEKGTLDSLFAEKNADPWTPSESLQTMLDEALTNVSRVLRHGGIFISISFGQPHFRKPLYLKVRYGWDMQVTTIGNDFHYFVYVFQKGSHNAPTVDLPLFTTKITFTPWPDGEESSSSEEDNTGEFLQKIHVEDNEFY